MKREIITVLRHVTGCCPGHDKYPGDTYSSNRSKRARSRSKKNEHQHARSILNRNAKKQQIFETDN